VLDKPAGLLAVPLERRGGAPSIFEQVTAYLRPHGKRRPLVVHRIDRDTSGLVVFARHAAAQNRLRLQFKRHTVERVYWAVVYGHPEPPDGTWRDRLVWDEKVLIQKETHPRDPKGMDAVSHYQVLERFRTSSLVEVRLETGKRNQIRIQPGCAGTRSSGSGATSMALTNCGRSARAAGASCVSSGVRAPGDWRIASL
jgi:23S rRNA pseudouridine1911/1915/1917 synthase